ncbi:MAG TPA: hypothetical protein VK988_09390 [Acidimicrobiales bacterium]|nr:hypothetical protein [Acidimicrobiales bacterium]
MSDVGRFALALLFALIGALEGFFLGWVGAYFLGPTNAEIRAAGRSLVPPGAAIAWTGSGYRGDFPSRGPYESYIDTSEPDEDHLRRVDMYRRHGDATGWGLVGSENKDGGVVLYYTREGISADVYVFKGKASTTFRGEGSTSIDDASTSINSGRHEPTDARRRWIGRSVGVVAGVVVGVGTWLVFDRLVGAGDTGGKASRPPRASAPGEANRGRLR